MSIYFNWEDIVQIMIGAFALSVPISFSEEAWRFGESLPMPNLILVMVLSLLFLSFYAYQNVFQGDIRSRPFTYLSRIFLAYGITLLVVSLVLLSLDKLPLVGDPLTAFKRMIIISMPASMGAIVVDGLDKE